MNRGLMIIALALVVVAAGMRANRWMRDRANARTIEEMLKQNGLRPMAHGLLLYQLPPATMPATQPTGRGHHPEGQTVLYADAPDEGRPVFIRINGRVQTNDDIYEFRN